MGRAAIDDEAMRLLEQHNPDVQFDWTRMLKQPAASQPEPRRSGDSREGRSPAISSQSPVTSVQSAVSSSHSPVPGGSEAAALPEPAEALEGPEPLEPSEPVSPSESLEPWEPAVVPTEPLESVVPVPPDVQLSTDVAARYARLGAAGLARLRARYTDVIARLDEKSLEPSVKEELRAKAERLNPDAWGTEEEVADALEQYESVFEQLRPLVGRYPRRRRRRRV